MSKSVNNPIVQNASGLLGDTVVFRKVRGKMQLANKPAPSKRTTENQLAVKERFSEASIYAKRQLLIPEAAEMYEAGKTDKLHTAFLVAMTDYLKAPKVHDIDALGYQGAIGDTITVKASDDFMVKAVRVVITNADGKTIEEGQASPDPDGVHLWNYQVTAANPVLPGTTIKVVASDRPGNKTSKSLVL